MNQAIGDNMSLYLDLIAGEDYRYLDRMREEIRREGPCDDDCESTAPFIGMLPDESDHEDGSPLDFVRIPSREWEVYEQDFAQALKEGV
jgi:hypothetical protein